MTRLDPAGIEVAARALLAIDGLAPWEKLSALGKGKACTRAREAVAAYLAAVPAPEVETEEQWAVAFGHLDGTEHLDTWQDEESARRVVAQGMYSRYSNPHVVHRTASYTPWTPLTSSPA